ncbi:MAG: glutamine amidotransferase [Porticoccaceae bacterium]
MSKPLLIACAGHTFPEISAREGDFDDWISAGLGNHLPIQTLDMRQSPPLPQAASLAGVVVTGSQAMVSDREPWSERLAHWLRTLVEQNIPVLGICYGHQLLAHAFGGDVGYHPDGIEIGTTEIHLTSDAAKDPLFRDTPSRFSAQEVHRQSVLTLPEGAHWLARGAFEPHQAFRIGSCGWGVQFHPEFSATAMRGYIEQMHDALLSQKRDPHALASNVRATPQASALLARFADIAAENCHS